MTAVPWHTVALYACAFCPYQHRTKVTSYYRAQAAASLVNGFLLRFNLLRLPQDKYLTITMHSTTVVISLVNLMKYEATNTDLSWINNVIIIKASDVDRSLFAGQRKEIDTPTLSMKH